MKPVSLSARQPTWNPFSPGYRDDPYPHLRVLREESPVHRGINGRWMVLRYHHVKEALSNPDFRTLKLHEQLAAKQELIRAPGHDLTALCASVEKWLFFLDPPDHTQLRQLVVKIWNQYKVRAYIEEVAGQTIDNLRKKREADIVTDFAVPIPMRVISRILGLPEADYGRLRQWANQFAHALELFNSLHHMLRLNAAALEFYQYMEGIVAAKRRLPDDSFLSRFLDANDALDDRLSPAEVVSVFIILFFAGIETSIYLFSQSVLNMIRFPEQTEALRRHPGLLHTAVEEYIRFASPLQYTPRRPVVDTEVGDVLIRKGEVVMLSVAAANRDPAIFDDPETLRLDRRHNPHLSFGHSFHHCIGARLAREEMQVSLTHFVQAFPDIRLAPDRLPVWEDLIINRGLRSLPVLLT